jgi:hypothetical protein
LAKSISEEDYDESFPSLGAKKKLLRQKGKEKDIKRDIKEVEKVYIVGISDFRTHRPILDGQIIDITSEDESARPSIEIWSLQWDLLRMASLCGAVEAVADLTWDPRDDDTMNQYIEELEELGGDNDPIS